MRSRNLAIVFTSIVGYSDRIGRQTYEQTQHMLAVHEALLGPVFRAFGAWRIKVIGGTSLVAFELPTQALRCAAELQAAVERYNRTAPEIDRLQIRSGANLGDVRELRGDVFGDAVNIAARVEAQGDPGEVLFTEALFLSMNRAGLRAADLGLSELRGLPEPVRLYRLQAISEDLQAPERATRRGLTAGLRVAVGAGVAVVIAVAAALVAAGVRL